VLITLKHLTITLCKDGTDHSHTITQEMNLVTQYFGVSHLASKKPKMIEQVHRYEVVSLDESALRSINVTKIANLKICTTTLLVLFAFHIGIQWLVNVTYRRNDHFANLQRQIKMSESCMHSLQ
jgi:hypothetical protein